MRKDYLTPPNIWREKLNRWARKVFWRKERMAEDEQLRRELADLVRRTNKDPIKIRIGPPRGDTYIPICEAPILGEQVFIGLSDQSGEPDFCLYCGAWIPPRDGEGTCSRCDPPAARPAEEKS